MSTREQFVLDVNTQKGFSGFSLYSVDPANLFDTSSLSAVLSSDLTGFEDQLTMPNGVDTFTMTVSRP